MRQGQGISVVPNTLAHQGGVILGPGGLGGQALARGFGDVGADQNARTKVLYVDANVKTDRQGYVDGDGESWMNAKSTLQGGINAARYDYGTTTINYTHGKDAYVLVAPGDYSSEGRIAFSCGGNFHIIGITRPLGTDKGVLVGPTAPTTFAFGGSGSGLEVANLMIKTASGVIAMYWENLHSCWIHDNIFYGDGVNSTTGLYIDDSKNSVIENNLIEGHITAGINFLSTQSNKYLIHTIVRNNFIYKGADGILVTNNSQTTYCTAFDRNIISGVTDGIDIDVSAASGEIMVTDNYIYASGTAISGGTSRGNSTT